MIPTPQLPRLPEGIESEAELAERIHRAWRAAFAADPILLWHLHTLCEAGSPVAVAGDPISTGERAGRRWVYDQLAAYEALSPDDVTYTQEANDDA